MYKKVEHIELIWQNIFAKLYCRITMDMLHNQIKEKAFLCYVLSTEQTAHKRGFLMKRITQLTTSS